MSNAGVPGWSASSSARRCGERVTTPASSAPAAEAINGAWKRRPPKPYPTNPIRTGASAMSRSAQPTGTGGIRARQLVSPSRPWRMKSNVIDAAQPVSS